MIQPKHVTRPAGLVLSLMTMLSLGAASSNAQEESGTITCSSRADMIKDLKGGYSEQPVALGVTSAGTVMELWKATGGETWTIVVTLPSGESCVVGAGHDWVPIKQEASKGELS